MLQESRANCLLLCSCPQLMGCLANIKPHPVHSQWCNDSKFSRTHCFQFRVFRCFISQGFDDLQNSIVAWKEAGLPPSHFLSLPSRHPSPLCIRISQCASTHNGTRRVQKLRPLWILGQPSSLHTSRRATGNGRADSPTSCR